MTTIECEESTTVVKLPAGPRLPPAVQGVVALANRRIALEMLMRAVLRAPTTNDRDRSAWQSRPHVERGSAFNPDGTLTLALRTATQKPS